MPSCDEVISSFLAFSAEERSTPEMILRSEFSISTQKAALKRQKNRCASCGEKITKLGNAMSVRNSVPFRVSPHPSPLRGRVTYRFHPRKTRADVMFAQTVPPPNTDGFGMQCGCKGSPALKGRARPSLTRQTGSQTETSLLSTHSIASAI